jgi:addiction module HigA family antidote
MVQGDNRSPLPGAFLEKNPLAAGGKSNLKKVLQMISTRKPTHPGEILLGDVIKPLGLTITAAARDLGVNRKTLSALVNGKSALTPEMAIIIAHATKTSPESWLNMQTKLYLWTASKKNPAILLFSPG